jgi:hypothetical protein
VRSPSIWSKSPTPLLVLVPPPDHGHMSAVLLALVWPPKNWAQVEVPFRHQADGGFARLLVSAV